MRVTILTAVLKNVATSPTCNFLTDSQNVKKKKVLLFFALNPPLRIIHARISNNLNKEFIMLTKFTYLFSKTLSYLILRVCQTIVLVSVLPEFAKQSRLLCRVSVDFGSRLLSMVPLSNNFIMWRYMECFKTTAKKNKNRRRKERKG